MHVKMQRKQRKQQRNLYAIRRVQFYNHLTKKQELKINTPKTEAGMRTIPMLDAVKDAFEMIWEEQKENGWTDAEIDGMQIMLKRNASSATAELLFHF